MKKNFVRPELEVVNFFAQDVVTASGAFTGGNTYQDNELPMVPFSTQINDQI